MIFVDFGVRAGVEDQCRRPGSRKDGGYRRPGYTFDPAYEYRRRRHRRAGRPGSDHSGDVGHIEGLGQDVRVTDAFLIGNDTMRGFEVGGMGPRDNQTDDALGAKTYATGTVEVTFPIGLPEEFGIRGAAFTDFGTAFGADGPDDLIDDSMSLRMSTGVGLAWRSPLGPVRIDLAYPFLKTDFDKQQIFSFSFGTRF